MRRPWARDDSYERINAVLGYDQGSATGGLSLTALGHDASLLSTELSTSPASWTIR